MPNRKASPPSISSRTAAKIAVAILVVIAVAGFVLAGLGPRTPGEAGAQATQQGASSPTAAEEDTGGPSAVMFAPGSHRLSGSASAKLERLAETARKDKRTVAIKARFEMGADSGERMNLAHKRTVAVRQVFEANGISMRNLQMDISQVPAGALAPRDANRVEVAFR